jgi:hypothetical protein
MRNVEADLGPASSILFFARLKNTEQDFIPAPKNVKEEVQGFNVLATRKPKLILRSSGRLL